MSDGDLPQPNEDELEALFPVVRELASSLSPRRLEATAMSVVGYERSEIADRLGVSEPVVEEDLLAVMDELSDALRRHGAVGGAEEKRLERFAFGLALLTLIRPRADAR